MIGEARLWPKVLKVTVNCIREVDMLVSVINRHVIEGVELATKVVVDEDLVGRHPIRIKL